MVAKNKSKEELRKGNFHSYIPIVTADGDK